MEKMKFTTEEVSQIWYKWFSDDAVDAEKILKTGFRFLPREPRCQLCSAPFEGFGGTVMRSLFKKSRSQLNPKFCNVCEEFAVMYQGGAEVEMSMLFVDVRGSTALSESMSAMEFQKLINRFFVGTAKIITNENGLIEKLAGDAVAAFWGAGFAGKNYVKRTIRVAEKIIDAMKKEGIPVGVGLHAGVAYFGAMGEANGVVNISAIGDEVNTAARLASKAAEGEIILSERILEWAQMDGSIFESRTLELKGISEPMKVRVKKG